MTAKGYESAKPLIRKAIEEVLRSYGLATNRALRDKLVAAVQAAQRQHNREVFGQGD